AVAWTRLARRWREGYDRARGPAPGGPGGTRRALPHRPARLGQGRRAQPPPDPASPAGLVIPAAVAAAVVAIVAAATAVTGGPAGSPSRPGQQSTRPAAANGQA